MVKTGEEQLVRSSLVTDFQMNNFKDIMLGSKEQEVYNTMINAMPIVPNPFLTQN